MGREVKIENLTIGEYYSIFIESTFWLIPTKKLLNLEYVGKDNHRTNTFIFRDRNNKYYIMWKKDLKNLYHGNNKNS